MLDGELNLPREGDIIIINNEQYGRLKPSKTALVEELIVNSLDKDLITILNEFIDKKIDLSKNPKMVIALYESITKTELSDDIKKSSNDDIMFFIASSIEGFTAEDDDQRNKLNLLLQLIGGSIKVDWRSTQLYPEDLGAH